MNEIQVFRNEEFGEIRTLTIDGEPWFVGKDVAAILEYKDTSDALKKHVDNDDKGVGELPTPGGIQKVIIINESGLYSLVLSSKLPTAKKFKRWVTSEVLPSIRKHGAYMTPDTLEQILMNPDTIIKLATALKEEQDKRKALEAENQAQSRQIEAMRPAQIFAEAVCASEDTILIRELAKLLKQKGVDTGEKRLFTWMRDNDYLISQKGADRNMPTQKAMELGLFEITERTINTPLGDIKIRRTPRVTGKGQTYFINKLVPKSQNTPQLTETS